VSRALRAPVPGLVTGELRPSPATAHYLVRVLRLAPGASFVAFDPDARTEAEATLTVDAAGATVLTIGAVGPAAVVAKAPRVLLQGLAKGDKLDALVRDATELGATRVVLVDAARSVVKLEGKRRDERRARLTKIAEEAARQCGRADPPAIVGPLPLEDALSHAEGRRFALAPGASRPLGRELAGDVDGALTFAVGPEGGFTEGELAALEGGGFVRVSLGPFVLRTETVAACVLGAVRVLEVDEG